MNKHFTDLAWEEYLYWIENDKKTLTRINTLIKDIERNPFKGIGKPEPLKGDLSGYWSRRINQADRLIYAIEGKNESQKIVIVKCKEHY
ncbi:Txe/YoeB family addiction module toxin [Fusibacter sp. 3D3]|uniref:Txe/YoeB family addiction module toxin n=1 Tax=Fusibacter sp. 3D3 TaxID=1048380 RepID=UPI0008530ACB|nr:Txe/YoeB family addiction module toxin [Fusibacter sp. 3D3]GAU75634.1 YoeB toxin protein [Fusibacter sp. 3D3]